jgi:hypothetical protein
MVSLSEVRIVASEVGLPCDVRDLKKHLDHSLRRFLLDKSLQEGRPRPSVLRNELHKISVAAGRLGAFRPQAAYSPGLELGAYAIAAMAQPARDDAVRCGGIPNLPPLPWRISGPKYDNYREDEAIAIAFDWVCRIEVWAKKAAKDVEGQIARDKRERGNKHHETNAAFEAFFEELAEIYERAFGKKLGSSLIKGKAGGPAIRFISAVLKVARGKVATANAKDLTLTDRAIRERIVQHRRRMKKSGNREYKKI